MARRLAAMLVATFAAAVLAPDISAQATSTAGQTAQTPPATPLENAVTTPAPPRVVTPEQKALTAAGAIKDPAEKLAALKKIRTDFPNTVSAHNQADAVMLTLLLDTWPDRTAEIGEVFDRVAKATPTATAETRLIMLQRPVTQLLDKKVLLDRAEAAVETAMASLDPVRFIQSVVDQAKRSKQPEPTAAAALSRLQTAVGRGQELLGRIYAERGDSRAEAMLTSALKANPTSAPMALQLAGIEAKRGDDTAALDHYLLAALGSTLKPADEAAMTALFRKVRGTDANLEDALDRTYASALPNPVTPEKWKPTEKRSDRLVLAEAFTGSACGPCVSESLAFQALLERYPENAVVSLAYHVHIPGPDPMTTSGSAGRKEFYQVKGVPTFNVDGTLSRLGGGGRDNTAMVYDAYVKSIDKALETPARAVMSIVTGMTGDQIAVKIWASEIAPEAKGVKLHIVLAERKLRFSGENGIRFHEMVVRAVAGKNGEGMALPDNRVPSVKLMHEYTFDLAEIRKDITVSLAAEIAKRRKTETSAATTSATPREYRAENRAMTEINANDLVAIAFLQDDKKNILQAVRFDVKK